MKTNSIKYSLIGLFLLLAVFSFSQGINEKKPKPLTRILFVFDGSQSMYGIWQSDIKINIARKLLSNLLDSLSKVENLELALRVYGHQNIYPPQVCTDTKLEVPFGKNNSNQIKYRLSLITPKGTTPIAYALEQAGNDFTPCDNCRNIIVLITDGIEECGGDPCAVSEELQKNGLILKPFIIGIGRDFSDAFNCVGNYFDASSEKQFSKSLDIIINKALNATTTQVNLLDEYGKPTETNVNMTFYDNFSGIIKYNFIHTLNNKGLPDTLMIDPLLTYDIVVHTIPPVKADSIKLTSGKHTIIPVNAPQGYLNLKIGSYINIVKDLQCIIRKAGEVETINVQNFRQKEKYLTGIYDIEVLCLPRIYIDSVTIKQSHTTTIEIPMPGIAVIKKTTYGYGSLYLENNNKLEWIYNFRDNNPYQETLILQPGIYRVVFRSRYSDKSFFTIEKSFSVQSGKSINVKLF